MARDELHTGTVELADAVRRRRMVRRFDPDRPVSPDTVTHLLGLATRAPSAGFTQGWDFLVLDGDEDRTRFWSTAGNGVETEWSTGVCAAPVLIVCMSDPAAYLDRYAEPDKGWTDRDESRWPVPYWDTDTAMAAMLLLLGAVDAGLGALFFGVPPDRHEAVRAAFGVPSGRRLVGVVALGHEAARVRSPSLRRGRRPLSEVVHRGRFGVPPEADTGPGGG